MVDTKKIVDKILLNEYNMITDPKPDYPYCNKGHPLQTVWNEKRQKYVWDCPTCIQNMRR